MNENTRPADQQPKFFTRLLLSVNDSPRFRPTIYWFILLVGLLVWIAAQGALMNIPLWSRAMLPETDDTLTYMVKTKQMEECFYQDCPALNDLRAQLVEPLEAMRDGKVPPPEPNISKQRDLAISRIYPIYHPLFSMIVLGLKNFGLDLMSAYKAIWTVAPLFFGLAFAYLLYVLWGPGPAGLALLLLAFKVFPDTGLKTVVPSNISMGLAVLVWARLVSKKGEAPWTMILGSIVLITMHPMGRIYSFMAAVMSVLLSRSGSRPKVLLPVIFVVILIILAFITPPMIERPALGNPFLLPQDVHPGLKIIIGAGENITEVIANLVRLGPGLFGVLAIFFGAAALGFITASPERRPAALKVTLVNLFFFFGLFLHVSSHPADVIFRMWIPLVVILFGAVGQALWFALRRTWKFFVSVGRGAAAAPGFSPARAWPVILLALLIGYSIQMEGLAVEQLVSMTEYMQARQPLAVDDTQPKQLLSEAKPGDRVLYRSMILMPYFFIKGAMELGAVYYHPALAGTITETEWLTRPDVRFAVVYNPTVYHPAYEGISENAWWITSPDFHYSPLSRPRTDQPLAREGSIPADEIRWIEIRTEAEMLPDRLRVLIDEPSWADGLELEPLGPSGERLTTSNIRPRLPKTSPGWVDFDLSGTPQVRRFKLLIPRGQNKFAIRGLVFGQDQRNWPWAQKAQLTFLLMDASVGPVTRSFNPADLLPPPLNTRRISVLNDKGSSVLLRIDP